jgi:hypothetical protein
MLAGAVLFLRIPVSAQQVMRIDDRLVCSTCTIQLQLAGTLAPPPSIAGFVVAPLPSVARDSEGYFVSGPMAADSALAIYRPAGVLDHLYGRLGQGPGGVSWCTSSNYSTDRGRGYGLCN